jgi:hypothetical protein
MPTRLLPIALPPVHRETLGSYLGRLADANRLKPSTLPELLGQPRTAPRDADYPQSWSPTASNILATLTGRPVQTLIHALPALRNPSTTGFATLPQPVRPACRTCMAARGIHGLVIQHAARHECVCLRHRRWLATADQHRLDTLPEILTANIRHQRIMRRSGSPTSENPAHDTVRTWFTEATHRQLHERWTHRLHLLGEDPYGNPHYPSQERIDLATYPEAVTLTGLNRSQHWRERGDLANETLRRLGLTAPAQRPATGIVAPWT